MKNGEDMNFLKSLSLFRLLEKVRNLSPLLVKSILNQPAESGNREKTEWFFGRE
jgi:hypothetical protein